MNNPNWTIAKLQRDIASGAVTKCYWEVSNGLKTIDGSCTLNDADTSSTEFIPYKNLNQETALHWLFDLLGDEKAMIEGMLLPSEPPISVTPSLEEGLPW